MPLSPANVFAQLLAAAWTWRALTRVRRELPRRGLASQIPSPPRLPWAARGAVEKVLKRTSATCLQKSLIRQVWLLAHGRSHDLVIGVALDSGSFAAHAWLEGLPDVEDVTRFTEMTRRSSSGAVTGSEVHTVLSEVQ